MFKEAKLKLHFEFGNPVSRQMRVRKDTAVALERNGQTGIQFWLVHYTSSFRKQFKCWKIRLRNGAECLHPLGNSRLVIIHPFKAL